MWFALSDDADLTTIQSTIIMSISASTHTSSSAAKEWRYWRKTFENYLEFFPRPAKGEEAINKLRVFTNCEDVKVYDVI